MFSKTMLRTIGGTLLVIAAINNIGLLSPAKDILNGDQGFF